MKKLALILFSSILVLTIIFFIVFRYAVVPKKYNNMVLSYSKEYNIESALVYAIIKTESNFDKNAKSSAGAIGLMQLMPSTASWIASEFGEDFKSENLYNPEINIKYGCFYLNYLFKKFDNMGTVICAYNAGEGAVKNWLGENGEVEEDKISYRETKNYYKKVLRYYNFYKSDEIF